METWKVSRIIKDLASCLDLLFQSLLLNQAVSDPSYQRVTTPVTLRNPESHVLGELRERSKVVQDLGTEFEGYMFTLTTLECYLRPYRDEPSASRPIRADKHRRGQRVLTWVTSREHCAAAGFFLHLSTRCSIVAGPRGRNC